MRNLASVMVLVCLAASDPASAAAEQAYVTVTRPTVDRHYPGEGLAARLGTNETPNASFRRFRVGQYTVSLDVPMLLNAGGNVQVSAIDENGRYCKVSAWVKDAANIRCFGADGSAADARFSLLATRVTSSTPGLAYAWVDGTSSPASPQIDPDYGYAPGGGASVERTATGQYHLSLPGALEAGGNVQVTAYGDDAGNCSAASWSSGTVVVNCFSSAGSPVDASFSVLATDSRYAPAGGQINYLLADRPGESDYRPDTRFSKTNGEEPLVRRWSPGRYEVTLGPIATGGGTAQVTGYGSSARCEPTRWESGFVVVRCSAADGTPVDSEFSLLFVRAGPSRFIQPDLPVGEDIPIEVVAPTIRYELNVVEHLCINTTCEIGEEGWDKTTSEMEYDGTDTTSFEVDIPGSRLIRLCPVRRRTTDREFGGNGPSVRAHSTITQSGGALQLSAFMEAAETGSGSSIAFKTWNGEIFRAPPGWRISGFEPQHSETSYTDSNHEEDVPPVRGGTLVSEFRFKGDTGGNDIGNCTTDDTYMTLTYNPVNVTITALRNDLRPVRVPRNNWMIILNSFVTRINFAINNYDPTKSQPENGTPENRYYIDRSDTDAWDDLTAAEIRQASYYEFLSAGPGSASVSPTPLPVPAIRRNVFTFLLNNIVANGRLNRVTPAGDHIRLTIPFESNGPEVVAACVDNVACGTGEPHEAGKPIVQVDNLRLIPYLRLRVEREDGGARVRADLARIRMEADIMRDGVCRDNLFAFACGALAGDIERIVYNNVLVQVDEFVKNSAGLLGLLDRQINAGVCQLLETQDEDCRQLDNIVLDGNGDMLLWMRD